MRTTIEPSTTLFALCLGVYIRVLPTSFSHAHLLPFKPDQENTNCWTTATVVLTTDMAFYGVVFLYPPLVSFDLFLPLSSSKVYRNSVSPNGRACVNIVLRVSSKFGPSWAPVNIDVS